MQEHSFGAETVCWDIAGCQQIPSLIKSPIFSCLGNMVELGLKDQKEVFLRNVAGKGAIVWDIKYVIHMCTCVHVIFIPFAM